jgi:cellulose 1,4-beta-cellobiosidase
VSNTVFFLCTLTDLSSDTRAKIASIEDAIKNVGCSQIAALVIYNLPGRDCAAKASNGELAVGQVDVYKTQYIDREYPR